jgi:hypothetical protein
MRNSVEHRLSQKMVQCKATTLDIKQKPTLSMTFKPERSELDVASTYMMACKFFFKYLEISHQTIICLLEVLYSAITLISVLI